MPITAPIAAISLTSPAPVAPIAWPGSISSRPATIPATDAPTEMPLSPDAASAIPRAAIDPVSTFGIRRVRMSTIVAVSAPAASATNAGLKAGGGNRVPEDGGDRGAERGHGAHGHDRDERDQQS